MILRGRNFRRGERCLARLDSGNGFLHRFEVGQEPLVGFVSGIEDLAFDARTQQHAVHLLVVERAEMAVANEEGQLRVEQFVSNARRLRVLVDALPGSLVESPAIGQKP